MSKKTSALILNKALKRLQKANASMSVRKLADKIGVSHVFLRKLLQGEANIPIRRLESIAKAFQLDELSLGELRSLAKKQTDTPAASDEKPKAILKYDEESRNTYTALAHWYELPLLDLLTCDEEDLTTKGIAQRLQISEREVTDAFLRLKAVGLISEENGRLQKNSQYLRFPTKSSHPVIQNYYMEVLKRAQQELKKTSQDSFEKRLIANMTIAVDIDRLPEAKERLQKFIYDLSIELSQGKATEVYFLTTCFFPVTKTR